jgi:UPF0042 nucleotide-binding protein
MPENAPQIFIITGLSGSGMSSATNAFEDLHYFCVDNLPVTLLPTFARLVLPDDTGQAKIERAALVINIRGEQFLSGFETELEALRAQGLRVFVIFFEASDEVLQRRFSETRRPHPADDGGGLAEAIRDERQAMDNIRGLADLIVDTSEHTVHTLRHWLTEQFGSEHGPQMRVQVMSFGHKYGVPHDVDLLFDVRHLPNPYFISSLRDLSGHDRRIVEYLLDKPEVAETQRRFYELLAYLLPLYQREGKSYVTVGVGCTGGRHRSVMMANALARQLRQDSFDAHTFHRDVRKVKRKRTAPRK